MLDLEKDRQVGKWILGSRIGSGGNGVVWRACDDRGREAALKFLSPWTDEEGNYFFDAKRYARFKDELEAFRRCQDLDGVLPLFDSYCPGVQVPDLADPPWIALGLAQTLEDALGEDCALPDVISACASIAETLCQIHSRGMSHRDVKPDNLFLYDGKWCLGDFGLAAFAEKNAATSSTERLGPRFYIADEMLSDAANADGKKADVYSLAKTVWKLATGQAYPLQGQLSYTQQSMRLSTYATDPRAYLLEQVLSLATVHDPDARCEMVELHSELVSWSSRPLSEIKGTSVTHLGPRIEAILGDVAEQKKIVQEQNEQVFSQVSDFLNRFKPTLEKMRSAVQQLKLDSGREIEIHSGATPHILRPGWNDTFNDGEATFWWIAIGSTIRPSDNRPHTTFVLSVWIRIRVERIDLGERFLLDSPVQALAAASYYSTDPQNPTVIGSCHRSFLLNGAEQEHVVQEFSQLLEESFPVTLESAIASIERESGASAQ